jgi:hypothetical protein
MGGRIVLGVVAVVVGVVFAGTALRTQTLPAAERLSPAERERAKGSKKGGICVDVVIEEVDLAANTITARATHYVVPPHGHVGGAVFVTGTTGPPHKGKATRFVRLPVMPEANLKGKKPKAGLRAVLRLEMLRPGSLVVVGIEELTGAERIGVEWLDAPGTKAGN